MGTLFQDAGKNVTFHIGVRKKTIDMPTEDSFTVREDTGGVKINLTAASEGIEGDVLRRAPSPVDPSEFKYQKPKRGRPKKVKDSTTAAAQSQQEEELEEPPTMVRPQPLPVPAAAATVAGPSLAHQPPVPPAASLGGYQIHWFDNHPGHPNQPPPDPFEEFLNKESAVRLFKHQLSVLQQVGASTINQQSSQTSEMLFISRILWRRWNGEI